VLRKRQKKILGSRACDTRGRTRVYIICDEVARRTCLSGFTVQLGHAAFSEERDTKYSLRSAARACSAHFTRLQVVPLETNTAKLPNFSIVIF
jgi:hypothetical protein